MEKDRKGPAASIFYIVERTPHLRKLHGNQQAVSRWKNSSNYSFVMNLKKWMMNEDVHSKGGIVVRIRLVG